MAKILAIHERLDFQGRAWQSVLARPAAHQSILRRDGFEAIHLHRGKQSYAFLVDISFPIWRPVLARGWCWETAGARRKKADLVAIAEMVTASRHAMGADRLLHSSLPKGIARNSSWRISQVCPTMAI